jgi:hypothetical protein
MHAFTDLGDLTFQIYADNHTFIASRALLNNAVKNIRKSKRSPREREYIIFGRITPRSVFRIPFFPFGVSATRT